MRPSAGLQHQARLARKLQVAAEPILVFFPRVREINAVEFGKRTGERERLRFTFCFVEGEEMDAVLLEGTPERGADLLIRVREHAMHNEVRGVELIVSKIS